MKCIPGCKRSILHKGLQNNPKPYISLYIDMYIHIYKSLYNPFAAFATVAFTGVNLQSQGA